MVNLKHRTPIPITTAEDSAKLGKSVAPEGTAVKVALKLPNERDQSIDMTAETPDPVIEQAAEDVAHGLQDTSKGAELGRAYKKLK